MNEQPQYTLIKDITTYEYPMHMTRPNGFFGSNFFSKWIPDWQKHLSHLMGNPNVVGIEVGTLNGDMAVWSANELVNGQGSIQYSIDINETEHLKNNISPYSNIKFIRGTSYDVLRTLTHNNQTKGFADYVYLDGSHLAIDVLSDAVLAWSLLKDGGILCLDDYGWGIHTTDEKQKPKLAIDAFLAAYVGHYEILHFGWQVFLKKLPYTYSEEELNANYQK
jgi:cephalosporin hydroxylase